MPILKIWQLETNQEYQLYINPPNSLEGLTEIFHWYWGQFQAYASYLVSSMAPIATLQGRQNQL